MTLADRLAQHCARPIRAGDRKRASLHLVAWTGAAALAASAPSAQPFWQGLKALSLPDDPWHTLLFEASLGSLFEMDDTHRQALVHPAPVIVPVALAVARQNGASGQAILDAMVRGYEAMIRMGMSVGPTHYRYWHNTSTCGTVGAAVTAAHLLCLSAEQTAHAIRLALVQTSGLWQTRLDPCDAKPWHLSRTAQTGVQAAYLAQAGLRGPAFALEGKKGFFAATCPDARPEMLAAVLDADWQIHATSFKPWAACRHAHPAIHAAVGLRDTWSSQADALPWAEVQHIEIRTYDDAIAFCDRPDPSDAAQARFSLQHGVAVALCHGAPSPAAFDAPAIADPQIFTLRKTVRLVADAEYCQRYPLHFGARVTVYWHNGKCLSHAVHDTLGDPECPLSETVLLGIADNALASAGWQESERHARLAHTCALTQDTTGTGVAALSPLRPRDTSPSS
ncbi:MmgE/PrpD family protein [Bordetella tumbae]|uniref:MmgE/PrpD family protein n=1 Tax=Bordetella tumbae TaxID=1649139 RepID=UPI0039F01D14